MKHIEIKEKLIKPTNAQLKVNGGKNTNIATYKMIKIFKVLHFVSTFYFFYPLIDYS